MITCSTQGVSQRGENRTIASNASAFGAPLIRLDGAGGRVIVAKNSSLKVRRLGFVGLVAPLDMTSGG